MINFLKKRANLCLLIIEISLTILGTLSLIDNIIFLTTKKETAAMVTKIEILKLPKPYKVYLIYYNEYLSKSVTSYIADIDGIYGRKLPQPSGHLNIYYKKYFPKDIYLADYRFPNSGNVILNISFLLIMFIAIYFQAKKCMAGSVT